MKGGSECLTPPTARMMTSPAAAEHHQTDGNHLASLVECDADQHRHAASPCATFLTCNLSPLARPHRVPVVVQIERSACQKTRRGKVLLPSSSHNREGKGVINSPTSIEGRRGTDRGRGRRSKAPPAECRANIPMSNGSEGTDVETPLRARRLDTCALQGVHVWQRIA